MLQYKIEGGRPAPAHCAVSLRNMTADSISSSVLRETFKVNLSLMSFRVPNFNVR
jgi:hypothetical protein